MEKSAITNQMLALALETTGRVGSIAIGCGQALSDEKTFSAPLRHSAELFGTITELLEKSRKILNRTKHVYISIGPGSFTGIRISVTVAKMMALAAESKIVAVNTSDAMAMNVDDEKIKKLATIIDAKRGQFFVAAFERKNGSWEKTLADCMMGAEQFKEKFDSEPIWLLGEGLLYYSKKFETENIKILNEKFWSPRASNVFKIGAQSAAEGKFVDPAGLVPLYIRRPEAEENYEKNINL
jgi:tRNA threonylcarbamoyl adenosine modification protein YeaZ